MKSAEIEAKKLGLIKEEPKEEAAPEETKAPEKDRGSHCDHVCLCLWLVKCSSSHAEWAQSRPEGRWRLRPQQQVLGLSAN